MGERNWYAGVEQGVLGMRPGGLREVKVPPQLTYHERKNYPGLPEGAMLIYEIELLSIGQHFDLLLHVTEGVKFSEKAKALAQKVQAMKKANDPASEIEIAVNAMYAEMRQNEMDQSASAS